MVLLALGEELHLALGSATNEMNKLESTKEEALAGLGCVLRL